MTSTEINPVPTKPHLELVQTSGPEAPRINEQNLHILAIPASQTDSYKKNPAAFIPGYDHKSHAVIVDEPGLLRHATAKLRGQEPATYLHITAAKPRHLHSVK